MTKILPHPMGRKQRTKKHPLKGKPKSAAHRKAISEGLKRHHAKKRGGLSKSAHKTLSKIAGNIVGSGKRKKITPNERKKLAKEVKSKRQVTADKMAAKGISPRNYRVWNTNNSNTRY